MDARTEARDQGAARGGSDNRRETQQSAEKNRQAAEEAVERSRQTAEEAAESSRRVTEQAAEATVQTAEAVSVIGQTGVETVQQSLKSGLEMASQITDRSLKAVATAMGMPTKEGEETTQQVTRNVETIMQCGTVLAHGFQEISREWSNGAQSRVQRNLDGVARLMGCRTPQDAVKVQSELVRDGLEELIQTSRRVSELVMTVTDEAMGKIAAQQRDNAAMMEQRAR